MAMISKICSYGHNGIRRHCFTLVELLVAMVILVVMMGFLFQFTIGAQRIWAATTSDDEAFQSSQILMQVLTEDMENIMFSPYSNEDGDKNEYLDKNNIPIYVDSSGQTACFLTVGRRCDDIPLFVIYDYDSTKKALYRTVIKDKIDRNASEKIYPMALLGYDGTSYDGTSGFKDWDFVDKMLTNAKSADPKNTREVLCEKLQEFELKLAPGTEANDFLYIKNPIAFQVNFTIEQEERKDAKPGKYRHFSKTIFLSKFKDVFHI